MKRDGKGRFKSKRNNKFLLEFLKALFFTLFGCATTLAVIFIILRFVYLQRLTRIIWPNMFQLFLGWNAVTGIEPTCDCFYFYGVCGMKTFFILLLVQHAGYGITSQQVSFSSMKECMDDRNSIIQKWNEGNSSNGHDGYLSGDCLMVSQ